jgi:shikimate kinase
MATNRPAVPKLVFLVGFMGAGKTSVGRALGLRLGWGFLDLDDRVEEREGQTVGQIFENLGENRFREAETAALQELLIEPESEPLVVALGGGTFTRQRNIDMITGAGFPIIFLDGEAAELFERCEQEQRNRPLKRDAQQFQELYQKRRSSYLRANYRIDTSGKKIETIVAEVACCLGLP